MTASNIQSVPTSITVRWELEFNLKLGEVNSRFLEGLREKRLLGTKSKSGDWVYVPPKLFCERTMEPCEEWVEVSGNGIVDCCSVVYISPGEKETPFAFGMIHLEGANGLMMHHLGGADPDAFRPGTEVEIVWADNCVGSFSDIKYFRPRTK